MRGRAGISAIAKDLPIAKDLSITKDLPITKDLFIAKVGNRLPEMSM